MKEFEVELLTNIYNKGLNSNFDFWWQLFYFYSVFSSFCLMNEASGSHPSLLQEAPLMKHYLISSGLSSELLQQHMESLDSVCTELCVNKTDREEGTGSQR